MEGYKLDIREAMRIIVFFFSNETCWKSDPGKWRKTNMYQNYISKKIKYVSSLRDQKWVFTLVFSYKVSKCYLLSRVQFFVTPWTVVFQDPLSMGLSRQEYWSGLSFASPGNLPDRDQTLVSWISGNFFPIWAIREGKICASHDSLKLNFIF